MCIVYLIDCVLLRLVTQQRPSLKRAAEAQLSAGPGTVPDEFLQQLARNRQAQREHEAAQAEADVEDDGAHVPTEEELDAYAAESRLCCVVVHYFC